jgi:hypothetical protein
MTRTSYAATLLAALALGACGDSSFNVDRLTPAEVAGTYSVCVLRFVPENGILPVANLLDSVMDATPPAGRPSPSLALSGSQQRYDLVYTRVSDGFLRQLQGTTGLGDEEITVRFFEDQAGAVASEALLPSSVEFSFRDAPLRLTDTTGFYTVRRADYAAAAGVSESGLQDRINGRLEAALQVGSCP